MEYSLSKNDFEFIFKNTLSPLTPFQLTEQAYNLFCNEKNINYESKLIYNNKTYSYLELYNFIYFNRFSIFFK